LVKNGVTLDNLDSETRKKALVRKLSYGNTLRIKQLIKLQIINPREIKQLIKNHSEIGFKLI